MNKTTFIKQLAHELNYSEQKCIIINDILENNFFLSRSNQPKIVAELMSRLHLDETAATKVYDTAIRLIQTELKFKLRHPFGRQS